MRWNQISAATLFFIGTAGSAIGFIMMIRPLFFPALAVTLASFSILAVEMGSIGYLPIKLKQVDESVRILDILGFVSITAMSVIIIISPNGVPDLLYWLGAVTVVIVLFRTMLSPATLTFVQITLLALVLRSAIWYSAPVIGKDSRLHAALTEYTIETGKLIPTEVTYYHHYPISHILGSEVGLVTSLNSKSSIFIAATGGSIIGIGLIYLVSRRLLPVNGISKQRAGIYGTIALATSPSHINRGGLPIAQTLGLGLAPLVLYAVLRSEDRRFRFIALLSYGSLLLVHNLSPALTAGFVLLLGVSNAAIYRIKLTSIKNWKFKSLIAVTGIIAIIRFYESIGYFRLQVGRLIRIFAGDRSLTSDVQASVFGNSAIFTVRDPILHIGSGLYVMLAAFVIIFTSIVHSVRTNETPDIPYDWFIPAGIIFAVAGAAIVAGGTELTFRALGFIIIVVAPIIGVACIQLERATVGKLALLVLVLTSPILAIVAAESGIRNPSVSPTNRVDDVPVDLQREEWAAARFASQQGRNVRVDAYVYSSVVINRLGQSGPPTVSRGSIEPNSLNSTGRINELSREKLFQCGSYSLYRTRYQRYPGIKVPIDRSKVYDTGKAKIYSSDFNCQPIL